MPTEAYLHVWGYPTGCPACDNLKALLTALGVNFQFHPIERDSPARQQLRDAGFATVPQVFDLDGAHLGVEQVALGHW